MTLRNSEKYLPSYLTNTLTFLTSNYSKTTKLVISAFGDLEITKFEWLRIIFIFLGDFRDIYWSHVQSLQSQLQLVFQSTTFPLFIRIRFIQTLFFNDKRSLISKSNIYFSRVFRIVHKRAERNQNQLSSAFFISYQVSAVLRVWNCFLFGGSQTGTFPIPVIFLPQHFSLICPSSETWMNLEQPHM